MDIGIFIEYDNRVVQIPVNPQSFNVSTSGNNETEEIIALGEIVIPKKPSLSGISWESFFPYRSWFPAVRTSGDFKSADFYVNFFSGIQHACKPCRLTVTGIGIDTDVVIESFEFYHQAGDHEDTYYSISLKKYQPYAVSIVSKVDIEDQLRKTVQVTLGKPSSSVTIEPSQITIGSEAYLNGRVHRDSYGSSPGKTFTNYKCKVNLINKKGSHPYHVTNPSGGWLGWVTADSLSDVQLAKETNPQSNPIVANPPQVVTSPQTVKTYKPGGVTGRVV